VRHRELLKVVGSASLDVTGTYQD